MIKNSLKMVINQLNYVKLNANLTPKKIMEVGIKK